MIETILEYRFMQYAIYASLMAAIISGLIGVIIVEKKLVMMSGGIAHTSYGGVGFAYFAGIEPLLGALMISVLASVGIGTIKRKGSAKSDLAIGLFWSLGMALGILFIGLTPGYPPNVQSFLFGNILSVNTFDLMVLLVTTFVVMVVMIPFLNHWKLYAFDEEYATVRGLDTRLMDYVFFILIGFSVVALIMVIGIIMVIALFTAPTAIAELWTYRFGPRIILTISITILTFLAGLLVSTLLGVPTGAVIIILFVTTFVVSLGIKALQTSGRRRHASV
jgi:zinc transport system permease protein